MKRKIINKILFILVVITVITVSGCRNDSKNNASSDNGLSYSLTKDGSNCYISIKGSHDKGPLGCMEEIYIQFDSFDDMVERITKNKLTQDELADIERQFTKDANGQIPMIDIYNMMVPTLPEGVNVEYIDWDDGTRYKCVFKADILTSGYVEYYCGNKENPFFESQCEHFSESESYTEKTHIDDRDSDVYIYTGGNGETKCVCYNISVPNSNEAFHVEEYYLLSSESHPSWVSDTAPYYVTMWSKAESRKFFVVGYVFTERPSVEWLSSFGMEEYSSTD